MKASLPFKTLFRSPVKTALTFVLLAAVSFAFFTCMAEYAVTSREFKNAALQYRGVDAAEDGVGGAAGSHAAGQEVGALAIAEAKDMQCAHLHTLYAICFLHPLLLTCRWGDRPRSPV